MLCVTLASCSMVSWLWRNTSAGQSALVSAIFHDYGSSDVMLTRKPWSNWCIDCCYAMGCLSLLQSTISPPQRVQKSCCCMGHTWSFFTWPCLSSTVHDNHCPVYLRESVASASSDQQDINLDFIVPQTWNKFGDWAFSVASLMVWNSLQESVRSTKTLPSFKRNLKTHLFNIAFN